MTIGKLWLPSLESGFSVFTQQIAAAQYDNGTGFGNPQSVALPSSYVTVAGDCIVVGYCIGGSGTPTFSGCGGTWQTYQTGTAPVAGFAVGYGCTAGGTAFGVAGVSAEVGTLSISVWAGVKSSSNPVTGSAGGTGTNTVTSSSLTYAPGQLLLSMTGIGSAAGGPPLTTPTWSNGATPTNLTNFGGTDARPLRSDYVLPVTGTSTTVTYTTTSASPMRCEAIALSHA